MLKSALMEPPHPNLNKNGSERPSLIRPCTGGEIDADLALITRRQTSKTLSCSRESLKRWEKQGILTPILIGGSVRYLRQDIIELVRSRRCCRGQRKVKGGAS